MRFLLPAIAVSFGLHAGVLAYLGVPGGVEQGAEGDVSSTVIVFDTPVAFQPSASSEGEQASDQQPAEGVTEPVDEPAPVEQAQPEELVAEPEPVEEAKGDEPAAELEPAAEAKVETPVAEPEPEAVAVPFVPVPRAKPHVPADFADEPVREMVTPKTQPRTETGSRPAVKKRVNAEPRKRTTKKTAPGKTRKASGETKAASRSSAGSAGRSGGASSGEKAAYARRVLSHIQRYKRHPAGGKNGKVGLAVQISPSGSLSGVSVRSSSGDSVLDRAAVTTARSASPYPKPPGGNGFSFTVSLRYTR